MQISKYFASLGIDIDKSSVRKVDKTLSDLEKRLKTFGNNMGKPLNLNLEKFTVDQKKLNFALGSALDVASARTVFEISRFHVNQSRLNGVMMNAMANASAAASRVTSLSSGGGKGLGPLSPAEWSRRQDITRENASLRHQRQLELASLRPQRVSGGGLPIGGALGIGLAAAAGGYGLSSLNKLNQKVVAGELQSQAVVQQAGGTQEEGTDSFNWLRSQANRIGFNYLDATQSYNNTLAGLTHAGMTVGQGQNIFKGFSEIGRVNKLDAVHQKRLFYAISEVADMNQLQKRQLNMISLALPGGKSLFAEAYQKQTGGKLTGQAAEAALLAAVHGGQVNAGILTPAANLASERAAPNLANASKASQAEQSRYQNAISDLAKVASDNGVEEGFSRIFRTLSNGLNESNSLVIKLAEGFNDATKWADDLALWPQSFARALDGKDSLVGDWLGIGKTGQLIEDWKTIKGIFTDISTLKFDFLPNLQSTTHEIATILDGIAKIQNWRKGDLPATESSSSSSQQASFMGFTYTSPAAIASDAINNTMFNINKAKQRGDAVYGNPDGFFYNKPEAYDENQKSMALDLAAQQRDNGFTTQISLYVNVDPLTLANMDIQKAADDLGSQLTAIFSQTQVHFPQKE